MKKAIITGPTGAIGIALIKQLIEHEVEVVAVCRKGSARLKNLPVHSLVTCVEVDLDSLSELPQIVDTSFDVFYHFGWDGTFGSTRNDLSRQLKNIQYTLEAVEVASKIGCKRFIGAGSQAEYGRVEGVCSANTPTFPENGYGIAKLCAGQMSRILCEQMGLEHVWTRIFSIYGPYDAENTMIMSTIRSLQNGDIPSLTKGEQEWDYLYSADAGRAMYSIGEYGAHGKTYCIGSGTTRPLIEYVEILRDTIDKNAVLGIGQREYAEKQVMHLCADITELSNDTGFKPVYSFEQGIKETINWYKQFKYKE